MGLFAFCHFNLVILILISCTSFFSTTSAEETTTKPKDQTGELVNNLRLTHWDDWDAKANCPRGLYMIGLRLRLGLEEIQDKNVTTVTGFELKCSNRILEKNKTFRQATFGKGGKWGNRSECMSGFAIGIATNLSPTESYARTGSHILSMSMYCSDSPRDSAGRATVRNNDVMKLAVKNVRDYEQFCEAGDAIIGISIRADSIITFFKGDSTSVKGIGMECRRVVNPAITCSIIFKWETRPGLKCAEPFVRSTTPGDTTSQSQVNCTFQTWIGIGPNDKKQENDTLGIKSYASIGANNDEEFVKRTILKKILRPDIKEWFSTKFPDRPRLADTFVLERLRKKMQNITGEIDYKYKNPLIPNNLFRKIRKVINPKHEPVLEQLVGHCSIYKIAFDIFKARHHVYFEQSIKNRLTRIVFEL